MLIMKNKILKMIDPLSEQNYKNFMQYCSIPGFNSVLFSQRVIELYRKEEHFSKKERLCDIISAYRSICLSQYNNAMNAYNNFISNNDRSTKVLFLLNCIVKRQDNPLLQRF